MADAIQVSNPSGEKGLDWSSPGPAYVMTRVNMLWSWMNKVKERLVNEPNILEDFLKVWADTTKLHADPHEAYTPRLRELLNPLAPDLLKEWEDLISTYPPRDSEPVLSEAARAFQADVKAAESEDKETLWSHEDRHFQHARSNVLFAWFENVKKQLLNRRDVLLEIYADMTKVGLSGQVPDGFHGRMSRLLSPIAPGLLQDLTDILPERLMQAS